MKISLSWVLDHIQLSAAQRAKNIDAEDIAAKFNATTAEVEHVEKITYDIDTFSLVCVTEVDVIAGTIKAEHGVRPSFLQKKSVSLPFRADAQVGSFFLLKYEHKKYRFATLLDLHSSKDGQLPALWCTQEEFEGGWHRYFEQDHILILDNKSLTHRPDMWGHRGFAREIAALLGAPLKPDDHIFSSKPILHFTAHAPAGSGNAVSFDIKNTEICKRFAGISISFDAARASHLSMVIKLAKVDAKPIDFVVDTTNFVMFDIGQPMHAFDSAAIEGHTLLVRSARPGERLTLLDGQEILLTQDDCVVADQHKPLALAGIMGGLSSAVSMYTKELFVESANFDATAIRLTAARFKKRTEASLRFEKSLDPNQNTLAIARFLKLIDDFGVAHKAAEVIASAGPLVQERVITVTHEFIESRLGSPISHERVRQILYALGFGICIDDRNGTVLYTVTVPTSRALKDVVVAEDIFEEIARFVGYENIPLCLPTRLMKPIDTHYIMTVRALKKQCAFGMKMREGNNCALYDEDWLRELGVTVPDELLTLQNPVSEQWRRLVSSLLPHLLKNVAQNHEGSEKIGFFELAKTWDPVQPKGVSSKGEPPMERLTLAGVFYAYKKSLDFYAAKAEVQTIFDLIGMPVEWRKPSGLVPVWFNSHQTAELVHAEQLIGYAGMLSPYLVEHVAEGQGFMFELNANALLQYRPEGKTFEPLAKYQSVSLDISMKVPFAVTVAVLEAAIVKADYRIREVILIDFFEKPEWINVRGVTLRYGMVDEDKTMTKDEIEAVAQSVKDAVIELGVEIR